MKSRKLVAINAILAVAIYGFVYPMLPYAAGVACHHHLKEDCESLGGIQLIWQSSVIPLMITLTSLLAYRINETKPTHSKVLFLLWPVGIVAWGIVVWL